ncbi:YhgN family NAAT transporter [Spirochaeta cellobiosiphila]|uniref:YhgN family NAAT transporter n=1 Tax=Spirochaeta cellobiosiphila TaxID=504483 RepID=UPI00048CD38B|nr:YhgN family NAAT transporter [Spirochaeta cellobiosiphila]
MEFTSAVITLILIMDPFGNIPLFLSILKNFDPKKKRKIIIREMIIALFILIMFLFFGRYIMNGLHITQPALGLAGGIILFLISIKMIFPSETKKEKESVEQEDDPFIVPMAIPMIAGPSCMATLMLMASQYPDRKIDWLIALIIAWAVTLVILVSSAFFNKLLGRRGLRAAERLMGMILTTMSVQMLLNGIDVYLK